MTHLDLDAIAARAAHLYERTATIDPNAHPDFGQLTDADVPALIAEIRHQRATIERLRSEVEGFRYRLNSARKAAVLHGQGLLGSAELYAVLRLPWPPSTPVSGAVSPPQPDSGLPLHPDTPSASGGRTDDSVTTGAEQ